MKKKLSFILAICLSLNMIMQPVVAATMSDVTFQPVATYQEALRGDSEFEDLHPNGIIEIVGGTVELDEGGRDVADFAIIRRGGTEGRVTATLKIIDISTTYNEDYYISVNQERVEEDRESTPYIEKFKDNEDLSSGGDEDIIDLNLLYSEESEEEQEETEDITEGEENEELELSNAEEPKEEPEAVETETLETKKSLRDERNEYFGNVSDRPETMIRSANEKEQEDYKNKSEQFFRQNEGVEIPIVFEPGENIIHLSFNIIDDDIYESPEQAVFAIIDIEGAEKGDITDGYLNITDNEESETAYIDVSASTVYADPETGTAQIELTRHGAENTYTVVTVETEDGTAKAGIDYDSLKTNIIFVPGAAKRVVTVAVNREDYKNFKVNLSTKGNVELSTSSVTVECKQMLLQSSYASANGAKYETIPSNAFKWTGWGDGSPEIDSSSVYWDGLKYASVNYSVPDLYGYASMT